MQSGQICSLNYKRNIRDNYDLSNTISKQITNTIANNLKEYQIWQTTDLN